LRATQANSPQARDYLHELTLFYLDTLTSHPIYKKAYKKGMLDMPMHEDGAWHETPITHILPLWTRRPKHALYLAFHLTKDGFNGCYIMFPIVGKGEDRVRLLLHAYNTKDDVKRLIGSITTWTQEMMDIEASGDKNKLPTAARLAFDLINRDRQITNGTSSNAAENTNGVGKDGGSFNFMSGISASKIAPMVSGIGRMEIPSRII
jgi:8-amino-7-oxononanoate synthase